MEMTSRTIARRALLRGAGGLGLAGTLAKRAGAQGKEPLKLGITEPLTGSEAGYGADFVTVMRMATKDVNDAGGINGHPLELVVIDTQASPQLGINAANRLATIDKIPMFITAWSAVVKAQAPVANREKVLELSVGANAPDIAKLGDYVYTLFPLAEVDITALAKYTYEKLGKRRAAVAYINNETGIDAAKLYKATFESSSGQIVFFEAYDPKATDFSGMLLKLRAANPDMVHVHGLLVDTPLIIAQMRQLGLTQRVSSYSAGYNPKLLAQLGPAAEGFIVTSLAPGLDDNKNLPAFLERWNAEVKRPPNGLPYLQYNYDSILIAAKLYKHVLDKDQTPTGDTLREALLTIREFDGPLTGQTVVDGHHVKKPVYLLTVENGKFVPMATID
jgi:branched-chain amino acid transport system substrate-binding protein